MFESKVSPNMASTPVGTIYGTSSILLLYKMKEGEKVEPGNLICVDVDGMATAEVLPGTTAMGYATRRITSTIEADGSYAQEEMPEVEIMYEGLLVGKLLDGEVGDVGQVYSNTDTLGFTKMADPTEANHKRATLIQNLTADTALFHIEADITR